MTLLTADTFTAFIQPHDYDRALTDRTYRNSLTLYVIGDSADLAYWLASAACQGYLATFKRLEVYGEAPSYAGVLTPAYAIQHVDNYFVASTWRPQHHDALTTSSHADAQAIATKRGRGWRVVETPTLPPHINLLGAVERTRV